MQYMRVWFPSQLFFFFFLVAKAIKFHLTRMTCTTARPVYGQFPKNSQKIRKIASETKRNPMVQLVGENQLLRTTWPTLLFLHISIILFKKINIFFLFFLKRKGQRVTSKLLRNWTGSCFWFSYSTFGILFVNFFLTNSEFQSKVCPKMDLFVSPREFQSCDGSSWLINSIKS